MKSEILAFFQNKKLKRFWNLGFMNPHLTVRLRKKRLGKQNIIPNIESVSCLNGDFYD